MNSLYNNCSHYVCKAEKSNDSQAKRCRVLFGAILEQALIDLHTPGYVASAWKWFYTINYLDPCSFVNICETLNLNATNILKNLDPEKYNKHRVSKTAKQLKEDYRARQRRIEVQRGIGSLIREKRKAAKMTQQQVAVIIKNNHYTVSKCELGMLMFADKQLDALKVAFNIEQEINEILKEL